MISYLRALAVGLVALALPFSAMAQNIHPASATEAAPFLGDWTLDLQGPNGPGTFTVTLKTDKSALSNSRLPRTHERNFTQGLSSKRKARLLPVISCPRVLVLLLAARQACVVVAPYLPT